MTDLARSRLLDGRGSRERELQFGVPELAAFVQVIDSGGFTSAARRLHLSQPGVSSRVIRLERALGTVLFDRSSRQVALTDDGRTLLPHVRAVLHQIDAAVEAVGSRSRVPTGR